MTDIASFPLGDGEVLVEVDERAGLSRTARGDGPERARETFEAAFAQVRSAASTALATFTRLPPVERPTEVELKFGIKLDAQAGAIIARTGMQAQFEVKLRWQAAPDGTRPGDAAEDDTAPRAG